ncbi:MAG: T9SS type A sorting domain-containing protein, partial [Bacteroidota bacterium]
LAQRHTGQHFIPLSLELNLEEGVTCNGKSDGIAVAEVQGGNGHYTYSWDNGEQGPVAMALNAGWHTVTVSDLNGCAIEAEIDIPEPSPLNAIIETAPSAIYQPNGQVSVNATGGSSPYEYHWSVNAPQSDNVVTDLPQGNYEVTIVDANRCKLVENAEVDFISSTMEPKGVVVEHFSAFPNPTAGAFQLDLQLAVAQRVRISLYSSNGQRLLNMDVGTTQNLVEQLDLSAHPAGFYFLEIQTGERLLKEKILLMK